MELFGLHLRCSWSTLRQGGIKSTQLFILATIVFLTLFVTVMCIGVLMRYEVESDVINANSVSYWREELPLVQQFWFDLGIEELKSAMKRNNLRPRHPRNVLIYVVDGIGRDAIAAARFYNIVSPSKPQNLRWDSFEQTGKLKNSCSSTEVCDAFTVGTAVFGGVRTAFQLGGVDESVEFRNCSAAANVEHHVHSVLEQALTSGLRAGFVTTRRVTSPLMAALYAHVPDTSWECDATIPAGLMAIGCEDVARQLLRLDAHVVMGGGQQTLVSSVAKSPLDPIDERVCKSRDGRNLVRDWQLQQLAKRQQQSFAVLHDADALRQLNGSNVDRVLGVYANGDVQSGSGLNERVPLSLMVGKALEVLKRRENGYLLLVHSGIDESASLMEQTQKVLQLHALLNNTREASSDTLTLLLFTRGHYVQRVPDTSVETEVLVGLQDADGDEVLDARYNYMLADTLIYAHGPQSQLFSGIHEETYLAHAIAYALRIGNFDPKPNEKNNE